jgi:hypothetical protein
MVVWIHSMFYERSLIAEFISISISRTILKSLFFTKKIAYNLFKIQFDNEIDFLIFI